MAEIVEYVVEKKGLGSTTYFIASMEDGGQWIAGFFPAYMAPTPGEDPDEIIFQLANPDHTVTAPTREQAEQSLREWVEKSYAILERRTQRKPA